MTASPPRAPTAPAGSPSPPASQPNPNRSLAARRQRTREEIGRGNANALRHGVFALVANLPDVAVEIALQLAAHPDLDPIRDGRLVEDFALALVARRKAVLAMEREGLTETLTSYDMRLAPLCERLERTLHERAEHRRSARKLAAPDPLDRYRHRPGAAS